MSVPPLPPNAPTALGAESDGDDKPIRVEWAAAELEVLEKHLETFRTKSKDGRVKVLNDIVLPELKKVYVGTEWSLRKRVSGYFFPNCP